MGEHEVTESNDSMQSTEELSAVLEALMEAAEDGLPLVLNGHDYYPERALGEVADENRRLRWQLKNTRREGGKQAHTIHVLRAEIAEVRQLHSRAERGELRRLDREVARLTLLLESAREEITALNEKLSEQDLDDTAYNGGGDNDE